MAALPPRSSTRAGAKLSSPSPGHIVIVVVPASAEHVTVDIQAAATAKKPAHTRNPAVVISAPPPAEHATVHLPAAAAAAKKPARARSPVAISGPPAKHVTVDVVPATTAAKKPARARPPRAAEHVAVDMTKKKMSPPRSPLVRGVSAASLLLGAPAMFVAAMVTHRPSPFVHIAVIFVCVFFVGLFFQLREEEKDKQLTEQPHQMGRK